MTESLRKIYDAIKAYHSEKGYCPSVRDLCERTGILSTSTVHRKLKKLKLLGVINGDVRIPRSLTINPEADAPA